MKIDCCKTITLKANPNGPIATHQGGVLGDYVKVMPIPPKKQTKQTNKETNKLIALVPWPGIVWEAFVSIF